MRTSGILLHITSLPSPYGIGDLGPSAYEFVDFLSLSKQRFWQILPLTPSGTYVGNSPYASYSSFAGNPLLISPEFLVRDGFIAGEDLAGAPEEFAEQHRIHYPSVIQFKTRILHKAFETHRQREPVETSLLDFTLRNAFWLDDYALFVALKQTFEETPWNEWTDGLRFRDPKILDEWTDRLQERISRTKFYQYLFFRQWHQLKEYCSKKEVEIIGDVPIYVSHDSPEVWAHPELFKLDPERKPLYVSGAPPDYYSETGQLWGSPVYDWEALKKSGFAWWIQRIEHNLNLYHRIRLDHFRGFVAYWEIPATEETAVNGKWVEAPAEEFFSTLVRHFPHLPMVAEDLGFITQDVIEIRNRFGFPGMKILQFAFGADLPTNPYIPHNYNTNSFVYTGTHDNNTIQGWFKNEATAQERNGLLEYLGGTIDIGDLHWVMIRLAFSSVADVAIIPMQDILGLGEEARMNRPQQTRGNWTWRMSQSELTSALAQKLARLTYLYGRAF
jgi:4-alpha-glucanotransferase